MSSTKFMKYVLIATLTEMTYLIFFAGFQALFRIDLFSIFLSTIVASIMKSSSSSRMKVFVRQTTRVLLLFLLIEVIVAVFTFVRWFFVLHRLSLLRGVLVTYVALWISQCVSMALPSAIHFSSIGGKPLRIFRSFWKAWLDKW